MEQQNQYIVVEDFSQPENSEEYVFIEIDENMPQEEIIKFAQELNRDTQVVESVPASQPVQVEPSKRKRFKTVAGQGKHKTKDGMYWNILKSFTKDWEAMVLRVSEKEREQDHAEEQRELANQQAWEQNLIQRQSEALTRINNDFLNGLRELLQECKEKKQ